MGERDGVADPQPKILRGAPGDDDAARRALEGARGDPRPPHVALGVEQFERRLDGLPVERSVTGRTSVGSAAATVLEPMIPCTTGPAAGSIPASVAVIRCGLA